MMRMQVESWLAFARVASFVLPLFGLPASRVSRGALAMNALAFAQVIAYFAFERGWWRFACLRS